ncbi:Polyribonucleotide nucleotidyltransferase [Bienertia sinuspersici]
MMHCVIKPSSCLTESYCTFVYAFNEAKGREMLWQDLYKMHSTQKGPWLVMGDLNVVMNMEERIGSKVRVNEIQPGRQKLKKVNNNMIDLNRRGFNVIQVEEVKALQTMTEVQKELQQHPHNAKLIQDEKVAYSEYTQKHKVYLQYLR